MFFFIELRLRPLHDDHANHRINYNRNVTIAICSIIRFRETGLIERWKQRWWSADSCTSLEGPTSTAEPVDVLSLAGLFMVLVLALGVASVCLVVEHIQAAYSCRSPTVCPQTTEHNQHTQLKRSTHQTHTL